MIAYLEMDLNILCCELKKKQKAKQELPLEMCYYSNFSKKKFSFKTTSRQSKSMY